MQLYVQHTVQYIWAFPPILVNYTTVIFKLNMMQQNAAYNFQEINTVHKCRPFTITEHSRYKTEIALNICTCI